MTVFLLIVVLSVWLPAWIGMLQNKAENNELYGDLFSLNESLQNSDLLRRVCLNSSETDFDNDGVTNSAEYELGLNPFNIDTDRDGIIDGVEIKNNTDAKTKNDDLINLIEKADKSNKKDIEMPFVKNDMVIWCDDYESKAYNSIAQTLNGNYVISDFNGYVRFRESEATAYVIRNGYYEKLEYVDASQAYRVDAENEPVYITISANEKEYVTQFTLFSKNKTIKNEKIGKILEFLLPASDSWLCAKRIAEENNEEPIKAEEQNIVTTMEFPEVDGLEEQMLKKCSYDLKVIKAVYDAIDNDQSVSCCVFNLSQYEIVYVYGYDNYGNLLVCDKDYNKLGTIPIIPKNTFRYSGDELVQVEYFEFMIDGEIKNDWNISFFSLS